MERMMLYAILHVRHKIQWDPVNLSGTDQSKAVETTELSSLAKRKKL